jgi:hypothetical protein
MKHWGLAEQAAHRDRHSARRRVLGLLMGLGAAGLGTAFAQPEQAVELVVTVDEAPPRRYSLRELMAMPQQDVEIKLRSGGTQGWRGVPVTEVLKAAGLDLASNLGGGFVSRRVMAVRAKDGYTAAFGLAEIDPRFGRQVPIVVWQEADGTALASHRGPLMLIAPDDGRASRGVRQLHSLQVLALP